MRHCGVWLGSALCCLAVASGAAEPGVRLVGFEALTPLPRAGRPVSLVARLANTTPSAMTVTANLTLPTDVATVGPPARRTVRLTGEGVARLEWTIRARRATMGQIRLELLAGPRAMASGSLTMSFLAPRAIEKYQPIPEARPLQTDMLVGAHNCPLWEADRPEMWDNVIKHPERTPALGFYAQENPEVADWETKWAVEHGVSFFIYCWYRTSQGGPVQQAFGSAIHQALMRSRFRSKMKYTIMWENQARGKAGVADERDLMTNLLPFWINNYFRTPGYLKVDGKPVLFIYRPEFLVDDLGGVPAVRRALDRMRQACRDAGFAGLTILGEYRGLDENHLRLMQSLGLDYTFAYCWGVGGSPPPAEVVRSQMYQIKRTQELAILPQVITVSQAWSGWADEGSIWKLPPADWEGLLRQAKTVAQSIPKEQLGSRMLLLDNWNEWGEGHYIAPYREYGFGYLDAVRRVFAQSAPTAHEDLLPDDIGRGPYDLPFRARRAKAEAARVQASRRVLKAGAPAMGLVAWWSFDEPAGTPVALDVSGNRLGAAILGARRAPGIDGSALRCDGGCAVVESAPALSITGQVTIECWVKPSTTNQPNNWMVNRVLSGGTATGYRLGLIDGRPCFEVPLTEFSHHLTAPDRLDAGRWTHLAGVFDGAVMKLYVNGEERASLPRPGPIAPSALHLVLGSYEVSHPAFFRGLLDEVRLWNRALSAAEVRAHHRALASRAVPAR